MQVNDYQVTLSDGDYTVLDKMPLLDTTERLEFLTDVHEHYDGTESRYQLRSTPRQMINYKLSVNNDEYPLLMKRLRENLRKPFLIPSYERKQIFQATGTNRYSILNSNEIFNEFTLIRDNGNIHILDNRNLSSNSYVPSGQTLLECYPVYKCMLIDSATLLKNGKYSRIELTFDVLNPFNYTGYYPTSLTSIVHRLLNDDYIENQYQQHQILQIEDTAQFYHSHWDKSQERKTIRLVLKNKDEYKITKQWLYYIAGRYRAFVLPDFENKLDVLRFENGYLIVKDTFFNAKEIIIYYYRTSFIERHIYKIEEIKRINGELHLKTTFNRPNNLRFDVFPAHYYRLESDNIEFHFFGNNICELNLPIKQVYE